VGEATSTPYRPEGEEPPIMVFTLGGWKIQGFSLILGAELSGPGYKCLETAAHD